MKGKHSDTSQSLPTSHLGIGKNQNFHKDRNKESATFHPLAFLSGTLPSTLVRIRLNIFPFPFVSIFSGLQRFINFSPKQHRAQPEHFLHHTRTFPFGFALFTVSCLPSARLLLLDATVPARSRTPLRAVLSGLSLFCHQTSTSVSAIPPPNRENWLNITVLLFTSSRFSWSAGQICAIIPPSMIAPCFANSSSHCRGEFLKKETIAAFPCVFVLHQCASTLCNSSQIKIRKSASSALQLSPPQPIFLRRHKKAVNCSLDGALHQVWHPTLRTSHASAPFPRHDQAAPLTSRTRSTCQELPEEIHRW